MSTQAVTITIYLAGNLFRIFLLCQLLKAFFKQQAGSGNRKMRCAALAAFFIVNNVCFLGCHHTEAVQCFNVCQCPEAALCYKTVLYLSNYAGVLLLALTFEVKWKHRVLATVIIVTLNLLIENLIFRAMVCAEAERIMPSIIAVTDFAMLIVLLLMYRYSDIDAGQDIPYFEFVSIILVPLVSGFVSIAVLNNCECKISANVGAMGLLLLNIAVLFLLEKLAKIYRSHENVMALENQNQVYIRQMELLRESEARAAALRHDMRNHLTVLGYMAERHGNREISEYLLKISDFTRNSERHVNTGDYLIDGLINMKIGEVLKMPGAVVNHHVHIENMELMDQMDKAMLLGNLFDNAVEALKKCSGKRDFKIVIEEARGTMLIEMENSYGEPLKCEGGSFLSTKAEKENHGIGIKNIKRIVEKYNGQAEFYTEGDIFCVDIIMYLNRNA